MDAVADQLLTLQHSPGKDWDLFDRGLGIVRIPSGLPATPIPDDGHNPEGLDRHFLDGLNQPGIDVELLLPLDLLVHHRPSRYGLVVSDVDTIGVNNLKVYGPGDLPAINLGVETLLDNMVLILAMLQDFVDRRPKD